MLLGQVNHTVKVTYLKGKGYGVRVYINGELNQEALALTKQDIGPTARSLLRMEDKCGNWSDYADQARHRITRKELKRREEDGKLSPSPTMP